MKHKIQFDPGSVLLLGVVLFSLQWKDAAALFVAAVVHEMGHLIAFFLCGVHMNGVRFTLSGPVMHYEAANSGRVTFCTALAGPISGLLFACAFYPVWPLCAKISLLLSELDGVPESERGAHFACSVCCIMDDDTVIRVEGRCEGSIAFAPSGEGGFGYDPVFLKDGVSFAELTAEQKDSLSHRGNALRMLRDKLYQHMFGGQTDADK